MMEETKECKCKNYTLEEIFHLRMNLKKCPRCKKELNKNPKEYLTYVQPYL